MNNKLTLQEAALLQSLNHDSNLVQFLGACISKESQEACLVLEYMEVGLQTSCAIVKGLMPILLHPSVLLNAARSGHPMFQTCPVDAGW